MKKIWEKTKDYAFLFVAPLLAVETEQAFDLKPTGDFADLGNLSLDQIIGALIRLALVIAAIVFFIILVVGGIRWIVSGGDKAQTETARGQITAALVGLVIVFAAWAIAQLISTFFGIDILNFKFTGIE